MSALQVFALALCLIGWGGMAWFFVTSELDRRQQRRHIETHLGKERLGK